VRLKALQLWHLKRFCRKYGLDYQLIDLSLTYHENKSYLESLVPQDVEDLLWEGESQQEWFMKNHFLSYYVGCILDGKTRSKEVGKPRIGFSLKAYIEANT